MKLWLLFSAPVGKKLLKKEFSKVLKEASVTLKQITKGSLYVPKKHSSILNRNRRNEDPAFLGPGLVEPPGGNVYANRYYSFLNFKQQCDMNKKK